MNPNSAHRYNKLCGKIRKLISKLRHLPPEDTLRVSITNVLLRKLKGMGVVKAARSLADVEEIPASRFIERRLNVLILKNKMVSNKDHANNYIESGRKIRLHSLTQRLGSDQRSSRTPPPWCRLRTKTTLHGRRVRRLNVRCTSSRTLLTISISWTCDKCILRALSGNDMTNAILKCLLRGLSDNDSVFVEVFLQRRHNCQYE